MVVRPVLGMPFKFVKDDTRQGRGIWFFEWHPVTISLQVAITMRQMIGNTFNNIISESIGNVPYVLI